MKKKGKVESRRHREREEDFTGGAIHALSVHVGTTGDKELDREIRELVERSGCTASEPLIQELLVTALKLGKDDIGIGELKLINRSLKEMRAANRVFRPYRDRPKVTVYGSARTEPDSPAYQAALSFSTRMREEGWMSITGAGDGIMDAAQVGAGREESFGLNINLPFEQGANETIGGDRKLVTFNYFFTRKLAFVKEAQGFALFPGGFGTMDEGFELLTLMQTGKVAIMPVVLVDEPGGTYWKTWRHFVDVQLLAQGLISKSDFSLFKITDRVEEAVEEIAGFYKVFHSYRFVGKRMVVRLTTRLTNAAVGALNDDFSDLLEEGEFEQGEALPEEANEEALIELPRLILTPKRRNFGRLRQFIDAINSSEVAEKT
ncbi:MAG: LOG family protein [Verrucomicrobiales bacterium]|nr:LOG family protein [Verrucomicrobiales bacterium]